MNASTQTDPHFDAIADRLWTAERTRQPIAPIRDELAALAKGDVVGAAYAVQRLVADRRLKNGARLVGRKIGLTSKAVQKQLGVDSPDFGALYADMAAGDGEEVPWTRTMQPKVEAEIALVLERDLDHERHTVADLLRAVGFVLPAIEIVGSRIQNWDIRLADTVADNASSGLFVLGTRPALLRDVDLASCGMVMERRGDQVSLGAGAACLGHPLNAALWLADMMVRMGEPLRAGQTVLTGALGPMVAAQPGDVFSARIENVGSVTAAFGLEQ